LRRGLGLLGMVFTMINGETYKMAVIRILKELHKVVITDDANERIKMCADICQAYSMLNDAIDNEYHDEFVSYIALCAYATGIIALSDDKDVRQEGAESIASALGEIGHKIYF
jgi:hypothetical protein